MKQHNYELHVEWTGNTGEGTKTYKSYSRDLTIASANKPEILASADPSFRGDASRYNPEELLVASLSGCHMLSYLHLCTVNKINVLEYRDYASGIMQQDNSGSGEFVRVTLKPRVTVSAGDDRAKALALHHDAHNVCFIARSVKFPVEVAAEIVEAPGSTV
jgi:organic hydroperoxide reductase OsmC/OhrA